MKNQNEITKKWIDGRMAQGVYTQWLIDEHPEALDLKILFIISRLTLGYRKRYAFIKSEVFYEKGISEATRKRHIKKAKELGFLKYSKTKGFTRFELILPKEIEDNVLWLKSNSSVGSVGSKNKESEEESPKSLLG